MNACPLSAIPLRRDDRDVALDLQAVLDRCYEEGRYDDIDYREDPEPPLGSDDARWAEALLREQGRRRVIVQMPPTALVYRLGIALLPRLHCQFTRLGDHRSRVTLVQPGRAEAIELHQPELIA